MLDWPLVKPIRRKQETQYEWNKNTFLLAIKYNNEFATSHWFS